MTQGKSVNTSDIPAFVAAGLTPAQVAGKLGCTTRWALQLMRRVGYTPPVVPPVSEPRKTKKPTIDGDRWVAINGQRPTNTQGKAPEMVKFDSHAGVAFLDGEPVQPGAVDGMQRLESPWFRAQVWVR